MTGTLLLSFDGLRPNPDWAKLPIFDRKGWKRMPFGAFADSINERVEPIDAADEIYVGLEHLDSQNLHIRRWGKGSDVIGTKLCFRKGDIIFGRRRAYQRKLAVAEFDGICSAHAMVVRAKPEMVLPEFLPFLMMSDKFMNRAVEISVGSLSPTINWKTLKLEEFDLPPFDQQHRIAEILWVVDGTANCYDLLCAECKILYSSTLHYLSTGAAKHAKGSLTEFVEFITDGDHNPPQRHPSGIPHLVVKHVEEGKLKLDECTYVSSVDFEKVRKRYDPRENDLVLTCVGSIGRIALVPKNFIFSADRSLALIRVSERKLTHCFAKELLESDAVQEQMASKAIGTAQKHLYLKDIRQLQVTVPDIATQNTILSRLNPIKDSLLAAGLNAKELRRYGMQFISIQLSEERA